MYSVGDLVICEGDNELYLYLGEGAWDGWGSFMRVNDGYVCQLASIMCSKH